MSDLVRRKAWVFIHDVLAHPICGLCWVLGLRRVGDWLHEATVHPLNYREEWWSPPIESITENDIRETETWIRTYHGIRSHE